MCYCMTVVDTRLILIHVVYHPILLGSEGLVVPIATMLGSCAVSSHNVCIYIDS